LDDDCISITGVTIKAERGDERCNCCPAPSTELLLLLLPLLLASTTAAPFLVRLAGAIGGIDAMNQ